MKTDNFLVSCFVHVTKFNRNGRGFTTYEQTNDRIESGKAVVLTADEIMDFVDKKGLDAAAEEVDVVTTATFGPT